MASGEGARVHGPFKAVAFDLLTALLDSWRLWNEVAGDEALGLAWRRAYLELTYGAGAYRPYEDIVAVAAVRAGVPAEVPGRLIAAWDRLQPWPEVPQVLRTLSARLPLAVVTNCSEALGARAVARLGVPIQAVVTAEAAGAYKPRAAPYRLALERLGTAPAETLFVAGSAADVPGASGVGMPVFWHNRLGLAPLPDARPAWTAETLRSLPDVV